MELGWSYCVPFTTCHRRIWTLGHLHPCQFFTKVKRWHSFCSCRLDHTVFSCLRFAGRLLEVQVSGINYTLIIHSVVNYNYQRACFTLGWEGLLAALKWLLKYGNSINFYNPVSAERNFQTCTLSMFSNRADKTLQPNATVSFLSSTDTWLRAFSFLSWRITYSQKYLASKMCLVWSLPLNRNAKSAFRSTV